MSTTNTVDLTPEVVDLKLYGVDPWAVAFDVDGLGTLVGATVAAKFRAKGSDTSTNLTVAVTDAAAGKFTVGASVPADGRYDIAITLAGGLPRTYICGTTRVQTDFA